MTAAHPAKYTASILDTLRALVADAHRVLDPFAGTGLVHHLHPNTWGVEIEPEWAALHPRTIVGDATRLPFPAGSFDCVVTSPTYGNRMADCHNARDGSKRFTYTHVLGRQLNLRNTGRMQFGSDYKAMHRQAWAEAKRVLEPGGRLIINVSDHIRKGAVVKVTGWHIAMCETLRFELVDAISVPTPRMRNGANSRLRVDAEAVLVFKTPAALALAEAMR